MSEPTLLRRAEADGNNREMFTVQVGHHSKGQREQHTDQVQYKTRVVDWLLKTLR